MKLLVAIKRVVDSECRINFKSDGSGVDETYVKMCTNPFDEIALEEAIRLKECGVANEVIVVSCGNISVKENLKNALAMGADRAILVHSEQQLAPLSVAKLLQAVVIRENPKLIFLGKQATDDDAYQVGQMLASLLEIGQAISVSQVILNKKNDTQVIVKCEVDQGVETVSLCFPAVITVDLKLNEPRYIKLSGILEAKNKKLDIVTACDLGVDITSKLKTLKIIPILPQKSCVILQSVESLVEKLIKEIKSF